MTARDYQLLASAIRETRARHANHPSETASLETLIRVLGERLGKENPRFDPAKFEAACAVGGQKP